MWARLPAMRMSGSGRTSCRTTQGSSPSPTRRFEPPPRNLWGMELESRRRRSSGSDSCLGLRGRSGVPPMAREVCAARAIPGCSSTRSSDSAETSVGSARRMRGGMLRCKEDHEVVAGAADVACADGEDGVAGAGFAEEKLDAVLHGVEIVDIFVAGFADGRGESFAGDTGNGLLAGGVDVGKD